jgi:hypothetical protein
MWHVEQVTGKKKSVLFISRDAKWGRRLTLGGGEGAGFSASDSLAQDESGADVPMASPPARRYRLVILLLHSLSLSGPSSDMRMLTRRGFTRFRRIKTC